MVQDGWGRLFPFQNIRIFENRRFENIHKTSTKQNCVDLKNISEIFWDRKFPYSSCTINYHFLLHLQQARRAILRISTTCYFAIRLLNLNPVLRLQAALRYQNVNRVPVTPITHRNRCRTIARSLSSRRAAAHQSPNTLGFSVRRSDIADKPAWCCDR